VTTLAAYLDRTDVAAAVGNLLGLRPYLGAAAGEDPHLKSWYGPAIDWCHEKISRRNFLTADGFADDKPPDAAVLGVYEYVRIMREYHARDNVLARKVKTGAREEEYDTPGMAGGMSAAAIAAWPYLEPYCEDVTLLASGGR
jgi:hypothetical protein